MDFFTIAEATSPSAIRRFLRSAAASTVAEQTTTADDDFSHLDTTHTSHHDTNINNNYDYQSDSIINENHNYNMNNNISNNNNYDDYFLAHSGSSPILSKIAEAELFMLATNFLLYVAIVLIITMIAKIYFPEALERTEVPQQPRTYNYRRIQSDTKSSSASSSNDDNDDDENSHISEGNEINHNKLSTGSVDDILYHDETDSSFDEDFQFIADSQALIDGDLAPTGSTQRLVGRHHKHHTGTNSNTINKTTNASPYTIVQKSFAFEQEATSKYDVLKRLFYCIISLNVTFIIWGVLQERMLTRRYPRYTGEFFTYSYALVFTNRFWTLIMSTLLWIYFQPKRSCSTVIYEYSFPSISNMLSSWCQYESLRYVSFPAVTLFKSFKLAPVMAMGKLLGNKQYPSYDYYVALCIGIGITMFMTSTDNLSIGFGYNIYDQKASATWTGIMLLGFFLLFDSFTSQWQSRMFQRHRDLSMIELMFATSAFSSLLSFITLVHSHELGPAVDFVLRHSEIHLHFFLFSICSTIGQLLIFYTIKNFGAVIFTLIMTTRVLLSIALSCYMYGHRVTETGFFGLMLVMAAVGYRVKKKAEGSPLLKWRGMDDDKAHELVQEWHEHADM